MAESGRIALVAGGSGLVGSKLLRILLEAPEYTRVHALSRRPLPLEGPRLANRVVSFDKSLQAQLQGLKCQDAYCCLGTTLREAGSPEAFRAVDHDLILEFARLAALAGAERMTVISSVGANPKSKNFYLRVKGETETALEGLPWKSLNILQPSVLLGARRDFRPLELLSQWGLVAVGPLLLGNAERYRAIDAGTVAAAMLGSVRSQRRGVSRYTYKMLQSVAANVAQR